jgi:autophagy-related protein 18
MSMCINAFVTATLLREGTMLVTASVTGTVLRLFSVPSGEHLCSFRRGTRSAEISSFCFSQRSSVLAVGSSSGTVHLFDVWAGLRKRQLATSSGPGAGAGSGVSQEGGTGSGEKERGAGSGGGEGGEGSWRDSLTSSAMTYLSMAQSWSKATVGGLNLLPQPMQEFAESMWSVSACSSCLCLPASQ